MRTLSPWLSFWLPASMASILVACGSTAQINPDASKVFKDAPGTVIDGSNGSDGSDGSDGTYDFGCGEGSACNLNQVCCSIPSQTDTTFQCETPANCPTGDTITCDGPDECAGTPNPICCGVDVGDGHGTQGNCGIAKLGSTCVATGGCPTHLATSCSDTSKVIICHVSADCSSDPNNPECCTFSSGGAMITFCTNSTDALGATSCH